ncbi:MAG: YidC/Oxa1 family membrane protein insertase [Oscillospiraceae bacterium]
MNILATPLGWVMKFCYHLISNYGIALLLFTFITRLIVFPLNIKQQKSTAKMSMLQPEIEKLQKKYKNDKEKLNEETMKLYSKEKINPMASCLPMLITLVILWSLIPVVYGPLTYVSDANKDNVAATNTLITNIYNAATEVKSADTSFEKLIEKADNDKDALAKELKKDKYSKTKKLANNNEAQFNQVVSAIMNHPDLDKFILDESKVPQKLVNSRPELTIFDFVKKDNGKYADVIPYKDVREAAKEFKYEIFGVSLGKIPSMKSLTALVPIISAVLQLLTTIISQRYQKKNNPAMSQQNMGCAMNAMLYGMPLFSLWICFSFPIGLGLYWIYSSLFSLIQTIVLNKFYSPDRIKEMVKKDMAKQKKKNKKNGKMSMMEKALAMQNGQDVKKIEQNDDDDEDEDRKLTKAERRELQNKRLEEARKRMAEKYGDEYTDNTDKKDK